MASEAHRLLQEGIAATKAGQPELARERLLQAIELDDHNEQVWLWLSQVVESDEDRYVCMENILTINPDNATARAGLEYLRQQGVSPPEPEPEESPQVAAETTPDWPLQQEDEPPAAEEFPWLAELGEEQPQAEAPPDRLSQQEPEEEQPQAEEVPSWLSEPEWSAPAESPVEQQQPPDWVESPWLAEMEAQFGPPEETPSAIAETTEEEQPAQATPAWTEEETAVDQDVPAWLSEEETAVGQATPAWMDEAETVTGQVAPTAETIPAQEVPEWVDALAEGEEEEREAEAEPVAETAPQEEKPRRPLLRVLGIVLVAVVLCLLLSAVGQFVVMPMLQGGLPVPQFQVVTPDSNFADVPVYPGAELLQYTPDSPDSWERYKLTNAQPAQILDFYKEEMTEAGWGLIQGDEKSATFIGEGRMILIVAEPYKDFILLTIGQREDPTAHPPPSPSPSTATPLSPSTPAPTNTPVVQYPTPTESLPTATPIPGWKKFEGAAARGGSVELWLPPNYLGLDPRKDLNLIIEDLKTLGPDYELLAEAIKQNQAAIALMAFDSELDDSGFLTNINITADQVISSMTLELLLESVVKQSPEHPSYRFVEQGIVPLDRYQAGRIVMESDYSGARVKQLIYIILEDNTAWTITFTTSADEFDRRLPVFEQSIRTFLVH
jgi:hypothetical protein